MIEVSDQAHLESLPDGTIIRWRRIPGDLTSEAVAFVRVEIDGFDTHDTACKFNECLCERTVWISPGGWQPLSPEDAGINYPVEVVLLPANTVEDHHVFVQPRDTLPYGGWEETEHDWPEQTPLESGVLMSGGTYPRDKALECAVQLCGPSFTARHNVETAILPIARVFEAWLAGEIDPPIVPHND